MFHLHGRQGIRRRFCNSCNRVSKTILVTVSPGNLGLAERFMGWRLELPYMDDRYTETVEPHIVVEHPRDDMLSWEPVKGTIVFPIEYDPSLLRRPLQGVNQCVLSFWRPTLSYHRRFHQYRQGGCYISIHESASRCLSMIGRPVFVGSKSLNDVAQ